MVRHARDASEGCSSELQLVDYFFSPRPSLLGPTRRQKTARRMNLRTTPARRFGHYTAQLLNPELEIGFIAACNPRLKLLVVYAFRRADFPGLAIGKNDTTEPQHRGEEKHFAGDWSSARLRSPFHGAKPSSKVRCSENQRIAGFRLNPRLEFGF